MKKDKSSIQAKVLRNMLFITFFSIGLWCLILIQGEYSSFKSESKVLRTKYVQSQKQILKKEVARVVSYINDMRRQAEQKFELSLIYPEEAKKQIQNEVLTRIVKLRFEKEGYFFGSTYKGSPLFSNGKITAGSGSIWNLTDPNGVKIIQEQRRAVENPDGGFVFYAWNKLDTKIPSPKISFVKGIPQWQWIIGAGAYIDTIEKTISEKKAALYSRFKREIARDMVILSILLCMVYFWSNRISKQIQQSVKTFSSFLEKAGTNSDFINSDDIQLTEFKEIAILTNKMLADRRRDREALEKSEEKFRSIFENAVEGFFQSTPEGRFISVNPAFTKMLGYESDEELIADISDIAQQYYVDFKDREHYQKLLRENGFVENFEFKARCKDGSHIYVSESTRAIYDTAGRIVRYEGNITDISKRKQQEKEKNILKAQLHQAQKMESIGTLAGGIAHDFNNILFPVVGYSEMLMTDFPEGSKVHESLSQIYKSALRASELVKQILTFSRHDRGELKPMKVQPIIKESLKLIRSTIPVTIKIEMNINDDCGLIKADPTQIHQIVMNLATNAYHAMEETGGELKIGLQKIRFKLSDLVNPDMTPGEYACLTIADTGTGMDKELIQRIFDPFFTTKAIGKGTGMGLSVVHGIVKKMNGFIEVCSELCKGTEFKLYFPIAESFFQTHPIQTHGTIKGGSERILLVDDELSIITMEKQMLNRLGYQVTTRTSSIDALELFGKNPGKFDIIITDMAMPNMSGDKLSAEVIKIRPDIPILLCTGFSEIMSEEKAAYYGIKGFILKPVAVRDLARKIRDMLD